MNDSLKRLELSARGPAPEPGVAAEERRAGPPLAFHRSGMVRRLVRHPSGVLGLGLLAAVGLSVLAAPVLVAGSPDGIHVDQLNLLPSGAHPFGTDFLGRDLLARTLYGGRLSLGVGCGVVAIEACAGVVLGLLAGYAGRVVDSAVMRLMDVLLTIPTLLLALGIIAILGTGLQSAVIALGVGGIPFYARLTRGMVLEVREQEYVLAARATGLSRRRTLFRHVLPNVLDPLIVMLTTNFGGAILAASALSYLGIGAQPPDADWGSLLKSGYDHMFVTWSGIVFPGIAVSMTILGATLLGDALTDARNPRG